jgi:hypothetical protein
VIQRILADVKILLPSIVAPGHGPVGNIAHLDVMDGYIRQLNALVQEAITHCASEQDIALISIPEEYQHFLFPIFFTTNLQFINQRQMNTGEKI